MTVHLEIPDDLLECLLPSGQEPSRLLLELSVAAAYRKGLLGKEYVASTLGLVGEDELNAYFDRYEIYDLTVEQFEKEMLDMERYLESQAKGIAA